ncbi:MAG: oxidoreductase [Chloroflexi bacterium]|jgi:predicted dehydrogenase|nr:MAG: hypothetical protein B6D42_04565 [Anaerolineae bacterium UTCFX5]RIK37367.1 MAG: oxidoreductase [Chloroflexota bacterium]
MSEPLRFGIVGCGRIAPRHAQAIRDIAEDEAISIVAACDVKEARVKHYTDTYGGKPYTNYHRMIEDPNVDVVTVAVPSGLHAQIGIDAAKAGKHVLVEKPIALRLEDADALIEACEQNGVTLGVVLQNRFNPPMRELRALVDSGALGKLYLGSATVRWFRPQVYYEDDWHGTRALDGGALMNQSIHHIDALQWFLGDAESVFTYSDTMAHRMECEDVGVSVLRFKNGAVATVEGSTLTYPENLEGSVALFGEHGSVKVGGTALNRKVFWKVAGELEHERELLRREEVDPPSVYGYSHREQILEMAHAIREGRQPATHGREARRSLRLVLAMYQSARERREVLLD